VALQNQGLRVLRQLKREFLKITEYFVASTDNTHFLAQTIFPHVFGFILNDYSEGHPATREAAVLSLITAVVKKSRSSLNEHVDKILELLFAPTVELIAERAEEFPEHRVNFFRMIQSLCQYCFDPFLEKLGENKIKIMDGIFWSLKHNEPATSKIGCEILVTLLNQIGIHPAIMVFVTLYLERIFEEVFSIVFDRMHQQGFRDQCSVLQRLFALSQFAKSNSNYSVSDEVRAKLNDVLDNLNSKLSSLDGMTKNQTTRFIEDCLSKCLNNLDTTTTTTERRNNNNNNNDENDESSPILQVSNEFCELMADFLIEVKVWGAENENNFLNEKETQELNSNLQGYQRPVVSMPLQQARQQQQQMLDY
jgi:exportin-1